MKGFMRLEAAHTRSLCDPGFPILKDLCAPGFPALEEVYDWRLPTLEDLFAEGSPH